MLIPPRFAVSSANLRLQKELNDLNFYPSEKLNSRTADSPRIIWSPSFKR